MADWEGMIAGLEDALRIYREDQAMGSAKALAAVIAYLGGKDAEKGAPRVEARLRQPLYDLLSELAGKRESANKELKPALDAATAVAAVELCKRAGDPVGTVAIPKVARATGGSLSVKQLTDLRKNMGRAKGQNYAREREHYRRVLQSAATNGARLSAREIADRAIELVQDRFAPRPKA